MGGLLGFRMGIIVESFQMFGIVLCCIEKLNMLVRALMACGPRCFRCKYEMPSGPVLVVFFVRWMASRVICVVKSGGWRSSVCRACRRRSITLSSCLWGSLLILA